MSISMRQKMKKLYIWGLTRSTPPRTNLISKQLFDCGSLNRPAVVKSLMGLNVVSIAAGFGFSIYAVRQSCGVKIYGAGINTDGQLGQVTQNSMNFLQLTPTNLECRNEDFMQRLQISAGRAHVVVTTDRGITFTVGNNSYGQCAHQNTNQKAGNLRSCVNKFDEIVYGEQVKIVECGQDHTLFIMKSGKLFSCGCAVDGQTGLGNYESTSVPQEVHGDVKDEKIVKVSSRADCVLALNDVGEVFGWGNSECGQLNEQYKNSKQINTPTYIKKVNQLGKIVDIATGGTICMALNDQGDVFTWGYGILGHGPNIEHLLKPRKIPSVLFGCNEFEKDVKVQNIFCGVFHMCALNSRGNMYAWGKNRFGCLGLGHRKDQFFPFKVAIEDKVEKIACGIDHTLAITSNSFTEES